MGWTVLQSERVRKMKYDEIWGIAFKRVSEFFSLQSDVEKVNDAVFRYASASVELEALPDKHMGSMIIAQTRVKIDGGADADEIHRRFYMRFLSAGG